MKSLQKSFPIVILGVGLVYLVFMYGFLNSYKTYGAGGETFDLDAYGALPVQDQGRFQPMDTVARVSLMLISGKQTFVDEKDNRQPAIRWMLDVMSCTESKEKYDAVMSYKVFRID